MAMTASSSPDVQHYLAIARLAFPQRDDAGLIEVADTVCEYVGANPSTHDAVGELTAELGNQAQAQQLVQAATAAYCPVSPTG